jgi:hypothetical protein
MRRRKESRAANEIRLVPILQGTTHPLSSLEPSQGANPADHAIGNQSIATFKGDLTSLSAPPFLLSPESICQFSRYFNEYPSLLVAPTKEESAEIRSLLVLKWFLSTLRLQHATTNDDGTKKKLKPLNPFLGEIFLGKWIDEEGSAHDLISEAVSHHPPCTAYHISNRDHGVTIQGQIEPKARFTGGTVTIARQGNGIVHIERHDERHVFTMPDIYLEGLVTFQIAPELKGTSYIRSSSGYTTKINYSCKGWLSGKRNSFVATIFRDGAENSPLYTVEGQWSGAYTIKDRKGKTIETVDFTSIRRAPLHVAPLEKQHPLETGKAWHGVIEGIKNNDIFAVGHEKNKVENAQRALRKQEQVSNALTQIVG